MTYEQYLELDKQLISKARDFDTFALGEGCYRIGDDGYVSEDDWNGILQTYKNKIEYLYIANKNISLVSAAKHTEEYELSILEEIVDILIADGDASVFYTEGEREDAANALQDYFKEEE